MHEILVSEEEAHHCVRRGNYLAIRPMLPELGAQREAAERERPASGSSAPATNVLDLRDTVELLRTHTAC